MNLLYRITYNAAVIGMTVLDMVIEVVGPPQDSAHNTVPGDVLTVRTERGRTFHRFHGWEDR